MLQWYMNSTGSLHPAWEKSTTVSSPFWRRSNEIVVPTHSSGPCTPRHSTRLGRVDSTISMVAARSGPPKKKASSPPTRASPSTVVVHHSATPSRVAMAS